MSEEQLLQRITVNPAIFSGKPIIRGRRLAVEHVLGMLAAEDNFDTLLEGYPWLDREDVLACLAYAHRLVEHERVETTNLKHGNRTDMDEEDGQDKHCFSYPLHPPHPCSKPDFA